VPLAILPAIQRLAEQVERLAEPSGKAVEAYLFPGCEHNFGFSGFRNIVKAFLERFQEAIPEDISEVASKHAEGLPSWFVFLSLPYVTHDSALNLTPLLHELGHFADLGMEIYTDVLPIDLSQIEAARVLVDQICQGMLGLSRGRQQAGSDTALSMEPRVEELRRDFVEQQVFADCERVVHNWIHELVADLFAIRLAGPAYFYSFATYAANIGLESKSEISHPSPAIRVDFMLRELVDLGYSSKESPSDIRCSLELWKEWAGGRPLEPDEDTIRVAYWAIRANQDKLGDAVRRHSASFAYTAKTWGEKVPGVIRDLGEGVPPVDTAGSSEGTFEPCEVADILNGAWYLYMFSLAKLDELLDSPAQDKRALTVRTLNELVMKGLEASEILRRCQGRP
jgi:hypothetical protein